MRYKARFLTEIQAKMINIKKSEIFFKKCLTNQKNCGIIIFVVRELTRKWGFSSAGRASALQAEGHRFEPCSPHHTAW